MPHPAWVLREYEIVAPGSPIGPRVVRVIVMFVASAEDCPDVTSTESRSAGEGTPVICVSLLGSVKLVLKLARASNEKNRTPTSTSPMTPKAAVFIPLPSTSPSRISAGKSRGGQNVHVFACDVLCSLAPCRDSPIRAVRAS